MQFSCLSSILGTSILFVSSSSHLVGLSSSEYYLSERNLHQRNQAIAANYDAVSNTSFHVDSSGIWSSVDNFITHLVNLTAYLMHQFIRFFGDLVLQDINQYENLEPQYSRSSSNSSCKFDGEGCSSSPRYCTDDTSSGIHAGALDIGEELLVDTPYDIIQTGHTQRGNCIVTQGLMLPFFGIKLAWRLALASLRCPFNCIRCAHAEVQSLKSRVHKTLLGSSDDIGWLQRTPGMAPTEDGTARFLELLENIRNGEKTLPNSFVYLLIPGLFSNLGPLYFVSTKRFFSKMGLACHIAKIHSEASVEHNARELKHYIDELYWGSGKRVMLLGHSKGGVDAAAALALYWPDLKYKVAGLALVQSPYGGTPLASDILRDGQIADKETRKIMEFLICKLIKGDIRALEDLTYDKRREFIMKHKLPDEIPIVSFHSEASIGPGVLATMTQVAQAELPWLPLSVLGVSEPDDTLQVGCQVPVVMPLSAAMAVCALHLQLRYGEKSDGLVTRCDAEVPGSVVVRPDKKLDHAWMVLSSRNKDPDEPDCSEMCQALLTMLVELGKIKESDSDITTGSN
ncbi:alpha/beta-Hydrolases superfamily protein [Euphorbia peplus]|nr:alpha/beta-Hydrolases superfamily protein [Euphorbia peplus]